MDSNKMRYNEYKLNITVFSKGEKNKKKTTKKYIENNINS